MIKEITFKNAGNLWNIKNENPLRQFAVPIFFLPNRFSARMCHQCMKNQMTVCPQPSGTFFL